MFEKAPTPKKNHTKFGGHLKLPANTFCRTCSVGGDAAQQSNFYNEGYSVRKAGVFKKIKNLYQMAVIVI